MVFKRRRSPRSRRPTQERCDESAGDSAGQLGLEGRRDPCGLPERFADGGAVEPRLASAQCSLSMSRLYVQTSWIRSAQGLQQRAASPTKRQLNHAVFKRITLRDGHIHRWEFQPPFVVIFANRPGLNTEATWRCGESNPGPDASFSRALRA